MIAPPSPPKRRGSPTAHRILKPDEHEREPILIKSLDELAGLGEEMEVVFLIENVPGWLWCGDHAARLAELIRNVDSPYLRMCFDTGHAHIEAARFGSVASQLEDCLDVVAYLHVHDNDGRRDSHLAPGEGTIAWEEIAAVLRDADHDDLICMIEMFDPAEDLERRLDPESKRGWLHDVLCITA